MKLFDKTGRYAMGNKQFEGRYRKFVCTIYFASDINAWYYVINSNDERDIRYNSLWDEIEFKTQEDCIKACQKYIDEVIKNAKVS